MRSAYLDCSSGISGDMLLGALVDAGVSLDVLNQAIESFGIPGAQVSAKEVRRCGFRATKVEVHADEGQEFRHLPKILQLIRSSSVPKPQQEQAERAFVRLAEVESHVHGIAIDEVHFHEIGAVDTIVDVVGAMLGFAELGIEQVVASPVPVGSGYVQTAHGRFAVPAPATAELIRKVPLAESSIEAELTTPTGALLLTQLATSFGPLPSMKVERIGCGAGARELPNQPNLVRLFIGEVTDSDAMTESVIGTDEVCLMETNLDDADGETVGYCIERLQQAGALDVWATPIQMKKNRPAVLLSVLCRPDETNKLETILFCETPTLGLRCRTVRRHVLRREPCEVVTDWGKIQGKIRYLPNGQVVFAPEYESCRQIAERHRLAFREVYRVACASFDLEKQK